MCFPMALANAPGPSGKSAKSQLRGIVRSGLPRMPFFCFFEPTRRRVRATKRPILPLRVTLVPSRGRAKARNALGCAMPRGGSFTLSDVREPALSRVCRALTLSPGRPCRDA
jgi:hypothetical protein